MGVNRDVPHFKVALIDLKFGCSSWLFLTFLFLHFTARANYFHWDLIVQRYQVRRRVTTNLQIYERYHRTQRRKYHNQAHWRSCRNYCGNYCLFSTCENIRPFLLTKRKIPTPTNIFQNHTWNLPNACGEIFHYDLMKPILNFLPIISKSVFVKTEHCLPPLEFSSEALWWQHHALGLVFFTWNRVLSQVWTVPNSSQCLRKTFRLLLESETKKLKMSRAAALSPSLH